jgi:hypothetical protein
MQKRIKEIKIRLTEQEYLMLMQRKTKTRLAEWIRDTALGQKPRAKVTPVDPELLYQLNKIGVNLNQIARYCHQNKGSMDMVSIGLTLRNIENHLKKALDNDREIL